LLVPPFPDRWDRGTDLGRQPVDEDSLRDDARKHSESVLLVETGAQVPQTRDEVPVKKPTTVQDPRALVVEILQLGVADAWGKLLKEVTEPLLTN